MPFTWPQSEVKNCPVVHESAYEILHDIRNATLFKAKEAKDYPDCSDVNIRNEWIISARQV